MSEPDHQLSDRELEVLVLVVDGLNNVEIAARLGLARSTVQSHVSSALAKTSTRTRTQLAVMALRRGIVSLHPES